MCDNSLMEQAIYHRHHTRLEERHLRKNIILTHLFGPIFHVPRRVNIRLLAHVAGTHIQRSHLYLRNLDRDRALITGQIRNAAGRSLYDDIASGFYQPDRLLEIRRIDRRAALLVDDMQMDHRSARLPTFDYFLRQSLRGREGINIIVVGLRQRRNGYSHLCHCPCLSKVGWFHQLIFFVRLHTQYSCSLRFES